MIPWYYFLLTLLLELPLVLLFYPRAKRFTLIIGVLLNAVTWPSLHLCIYYTDIPVPILETGVALVEGLGYALFLPGKKYRAFGVAFLVNGCSYGIGVLLNHYIMS
jgi:hypothetical protein